MRALKIVSTLAAIAATLLAIVPAGASARPARARRLAVNRPCRIHLNPAPGPLAPGETTSIEGTLKCPASQTAANRTITVFEQSASASAPKGFGQVGTATTEPIAGGPASIAQFALTPPAFLTDSTFYAVSEGVQSARRTVRVFAQISVSSPPTPAEDAQLFTDVGRNARPNEVTFAGQVSKADKGALVVLQRELGVGNEEWHAIGRSTVQEDGSYSIAHRFVIAGDANIRVVVHPQRINAPAATSPASYEISQAQNPALTIEPKNLPPSPIDPILFGQSVEIKGTVAGAANKSFVPVTLLARGRGDSFTVVATGKTDGNGNYSFTQAPLVSTFYRATTGAVNSSIMFEGVKYALTQTAPPSTVQAKQPLTLEGSVLPADAGHTVYLERQGPFKFGWSVIDVGVVGTPKNAGEPAPFSIVHTFQSRGARTLRVKIPGDPGNQGAAGTPFVVNVTPAPGTTSSPEAKAPKLPSEGQL